MLKSCGESVDLKLKVLCLTIKMDKQTLSDSLVSKVVADRYRTQRVLGRGGMGTVYLAEDGQLDGELVALKILNQELCSDENQVKRFLREVKMTRHVTNENIVRTYDVGLHNDRLFFTMEYVEGSTLKQLCSEEPLSVELVINILLQITLGLDAIHNAGIVHRDLKSSNIIMTNSGRVKIADFGVARPDVSEMTGHHELLGSIHSIAPEIWGGDQESPASDIYSLGVLAYELVTGVLPFDGGSPHEMMCKHLQVAPLAPIEIVDGIPLWFNDVILQMLDKNPANRPFSGADVREIIEAGLDTAEEHLEHDVMIESEDYDDEIEEADFEERHTLEDGNQKKVIPYGLPEQDSETGTLFNKQIQQEVSASLHKDKRLEVGMTLFLGFCKHVLPSCLAALLLLYPVSILAQEAWRTTLPSSSLGMILFTIIFQLGLISLLFSLPVMPAASICLGFREGMKTWGRTSRNLLILFSIIFIINCGRLEYAAGQVFEKYAFSKGQLLTSLQATAANLTEAALLLPLGTAFEAAVPFEEALFLETQSTALVPYLVYYFILCAFFMLIVGTLTREVFMFRSRLAAMIGTGFFVLAVIPGFLLFSLRDMVPELMPHILFQTQRLAVGPFSYNVSYSNLLVAGLNWFMIFAVMGVLIYLNKSDPAVPTNTLSGSRDIEKNQNWSLRKSP